MLNIINKLLDRFKQSRRRIDPVTESPDLDDSTARSIDAFYADPAISSSDIDMDDIKEPIIFGNIEANKTMLLVDDQCSVFYLYGLDFEAIKVRFNYDVLHEFKVVRCDGPEAGFIASKYIRNSPDEIMVGILDLTLGTIVKLSDGRTLLYDGVDIALELIELHPKCKIGICTAHMIDETNVAISGLISKFNTATGHSLLDYAFSKNSDRAAHIYSLITDIENKHYTDYSRSGDDAVVG